MVDMTPAGFDEAGGVDPSLPDPTEENLSETLALQRILPRIAHHS